MSRKILSAALVTLGLAVAIHTDWHFARPQHHRLSLGLTWHWAVAIPVFAVVAAYVSRAWPTRLSRASAGIVGIAVSVAGILEPLWEYAVGGAPFEWAFGAQRSIALLSFVGTGLAAYVVTLAWLRRRSGVPVPSGEAQR